jgi:DNA-binding CsgD family transcriptional regulator
MHSQGGNHFTDRESQILNLISLGHTDKEIAAQLRMSSRTVATHLNRIYQRRGLHSRAAAVTVWLGSQAESLPST